MSAHGPQLDWFGDPAAVRRQVQIEGPDDEGKVTLNLRNPQATLSLAEVPDGVVLLLRRTRTSGHTSQVTFTGCRAAHELVVPDQIDVSVADGTVGTIHIVGLPNQTQPASLIAGRYGTVIVERGEVVIAEEAAIDELVLAGGHAGGSLWSVERITANEVVGFSDNSYPRLDVGASTTLRLGGTRNEVSVLTLGHGAELRLEQDGTNQHQAPRLTVGSIDSRGGHVTIVGVEIQVSHLEHPLCISGLGGTVIAPDGALITDLRIEGDPHDKAPTLRAGRDSALIRFSGVFRPAMCAHATIHASPDRPYRFVGTAGQARQNQQHPLSGATLRGVLVTDDAGGLRMLRELDNAAVVDPYIDHIDMWAGAPWRGRRLPAEVREYRQGRDNVVALAPTPWSEHWVRERQQRRMHESAFFAQELAALVTRKSGSGSIRTKASWAAYRGRHLTVGSPLERWALSAFRLVGYGQRPGPAIATWILLCLALAVPLVWLVDRDASIVSAWAENVGRLAIAPLTLLRLAGDPDLREIHNWRDGLATVIQSIAALPFVFAVVATTRFLRAEWPWSAP